MQAVDPLPSGNPHRADDDAAITDVHHSGIGVMHSVFDHDTISGARHTVLAHIDLMRNTRPTPTSRHLAGFHRYPALEPLHRLITGNERIREVMTRLLGPDHRTIGLSDITVNRSQQWHKDLLRGRFLHHLGTERPCEQHHGKVFKVIMYLQDSTSLHFVPGSHRHDVSLESDRFAIPPDGTRVDRIDAALGDAVIVDICTTHRGSPEEAFQTQQAVDRPRILISTVFGGNRCEFADRMEFGNSERLHEWQRHHA